MTTLAEKRRAIRPLLEERNPADAMAAYFAFYHPDSKTQLVTYPPGDERATGYVALSRTGMDLFRPLVTLRLPGADMTAGADMIYQALPAGTAVIVNSPAHYLPLLQALFDVQAEEHLRLYALEPKRFEPVINVLVVQASSHNDLPRFIVRRSEVHDNEVVASATLNWQSPYFAEIAVTTSPSHQRRGWGRSVVAAMVQYLLENGRIPLYVAAERNEASIALAQSMGFIDTGAREVMIQGTLKSHPLSSDTSVGV